MIHHVKTFFTSSVVLRVATVFILVTGVGVALLFWMMPGGTSGAELIAKGVQVGGIDVSGLSRSQAAEVIRDRITALRLSYALKAVHASIDPNDAVKENVIATYDVDRAVKNAYAVGRDKNDLRSIVERMRTVVIGLNIVPIFSLDRVALRTTLEDRFKDDIVLTKNATVEVTVDGRGEPAAVVVPGSNGVSVDYDAVMRDTERRLAAFSGAVVRLPVSNGPPQLGAEDVAPLIGAAIAAVPRLPLSLAVKDEGWTLSKQTIASWITVEPVNGKAALAINKAKAEEFLSARAKSIATSPQDAEYEEKDGKVVHFVPALNGTTLDVDASIELIAETVFGAPMAVDEEEPKTITLPLKEIEPDITTEESNPHGIKEVIGVGATNFKGSPANRRHNIAVGADAVMGSLILPDEEFSLLKTLGAINASTGYKQELVIKDNQTKPEYGGGLCQIGSTAFRAALDSGMLITARRNHSYRVPYYERDGDGNNIGPGKDATIYDPAPDFKFKNDTAHAILITTKITGNKLEFFFWGVKDGRVAEQTKSKVFNIVAPPEKKIVETDTLPPGEEKCTEHAHVGSDAVFTYTVTYGDGTKKETDFFSRYRPWQEVCLVGKDPNAPPTVDPSISTTTPDGNLPSLDTSGTPGA